MKAKKDDEWRFKRNLVAETRIGDEITRIFGDMSKREISIFTTTILLLSELKLFKKNLEEKR